MKLFIAMAIFFSILSFALVSLSDTDEICRTWSNLRYLGCNLPQKIEYNYDGTFTTYKYFNFLDVLSRGTYQITKKWTDTEGYIWYKIIMNDLKKGKSYQLARVDKDARKLEFICKKDSYPSKLDSNKKGYCLYWRAILPYEPSP